jgi:hypothetical protein
MKHIIILLLTIVTSTFLQGQNNTCSTATPYTDNTFLVYNPATNWVELYRSFQSPTTTVDFSFVPFSSINTNGGATCPNIAIQYLLYDNNCLLLDANLTGSFVNLIPGNIYILGYVANCASAGIGGILTAEDIVLPVKLLYFTSKKGKIGIDLIWATASEINCAGFFIERSIDNYNWFNMGYIEGAGNSQQKIQYLFEDRKPMSGVNYYRLTQYDIDGDFEILQTIAIMWDEETQNSHFRMYNFLGQKTN